MDNNKKDNSEDVIKISLTDLLKIILACVLVLFLIGYVFILHSYTEDTIYNKNVVVNILNEHDDNLIIENSIENVIENSIENIIENTIENTIGNTIENVVGN